FRNVQILQFSDFHGAIENSSSQPGAARLATAFANDRKMSRATFTASSGDTIGGAPIISSHFREIPSIRAANGMKVDISTFGNHEHDRPLEHLREMISRSKFRWTVSNYSTRAPLHTRKQKVAPFSIVKRAGVKVGFVGMNTEDTPTLVAPGNLDYGNAGRSIAISGRTAPVNAQIRAARKAGADVVVALLHQGWQLNENGAAKGRLIDVSQDLRGADIAFGGHTHQGFRSIVRGMPVAEPRSSGHEYLRAELCLDTRKGEVVGSTIQPVAKEKVAELPPNPKVEKMVDDYAKKIIPVFDRKIGTVADLFPNGGNPAINRTGETALGDLLADTLRSKYQTDIVFLNGGGIRDTLPAAGYTPSDPSLRRPGDGSTGPYDAALGDVKSILPFGNNAATSKMTGAQLWTALEHAVTTYPSGRFPQISGFEFSFDLGQVPGSRVTAVTDTNGTPIPNDGTEYTVTTVDYMAFGGDGFGDLFNPGRAEIRSPYDEDLTAKLEADLALGQITPMGPLDGRITCLGVACVTR
ncbi:MAG: bifunctional metallophosphatase/5'-nucleotidase, partial [bacterium]